MVVTVSRNGNKPNRVDTLFGLAAKPVVVVTPLAITIFVPRLRLTLGNMLTAGVGAVLVVAVTLIVSGTPTASPREGTAVPSPIRVEVAPRNGRFGTAGIKFTCGGVPGTPTHTETRPAAGSAAL
jgi:hypothetical protein